VLVLSGQFLKLLGTLTLALLAVAAHLILKPRSVKSKFDRLSGELRGGSKATGLFSGRGRGKRDEDVSTPDDMEGGYDRSTAMGDNSDGDEGGDTLTFGAAGDNMRKRH
jgi:hypothetical protein